jgi:hypothetical protein
LKTVNPSNFISPTRYSSPSTTGISSRIHFFGFFAEEPLSSKYVILGSPIRAVT